MRFFTLQMLVLPPGGSDKMHVSILLSVGVSSKTFLMMRLFLFVLMPSASVNQQKIFWWELLASKILRPGCHPRCPSWLRAMHVVHHLAGCYAHIKLLTPPTIVKRVASQVLVVAGRLVHPSVSHDCLRSLMAGQACFVFLQFPC